MDANNLIAARGKLLEEMLSPRCKACTDAIADLAHQRDWSNGFLVAVLTRALMRTIDLQATPAEEKLQAEVVTAAGQLVLEYASDCYNDNAPLPSDGSVFISVPKGTEMTPEIVQKLAAEQLGVPVESINITALKKLN